MAGPTFVKIRYFNPDKGCIVGDTTNILGLDRPYKDGIRKPFFDVLWVGATQADEELGGAANSVKDGTTTPFQVTVVSASADDTDNAAKDVRKIALIGLTVRNPARYALGTTSVNYEKPRITVELIAMNGTTDVIATLWYIRVIHAYACDWGSAGGDAKGDITIESPADTDLLTIKAATNESNGCVLFFPEDYGVKLDMVRINPLDNSVAAADGCMLNIDEYGMERSTNVDPDIPTDSYYAMAPNNVAIERDAWSYYKRTSIQSKLTFTELLVANSQTYKIHCTLLIKMT